MCWGVPGKIVEIRDNIAKVEISGLRRDVVIDLISHPAVGQYVLVHAGYAIEKVNEAESSFTINFFKGRIDSA